MLGAFAKKCPKRAANEEHKTDDTERAKVPVRFVVGGTHQQQADEYTDEGDSNATLCTHERWQTACGSAASASERSPLQPRVRRQGCISLTHCMPLAKREALVRSYVVVAVRIERWAQLGHR